MVNRRICITSIHICFSGSCYVCISCVCCHPSHHKGSQRGLERHQPYQKKTFVLRISSCTICVSDILLGSRKLCRSCVFSDSEMWLYCFYHGGILSVKIAKVTPKVTLIIISGLWVPMISTVTLWPKLLQVPIILTECTF